MRTTVTLDSDVAATLKRLARERGASFKDTLNSVLRAGLAASRSKSKPYRVPSKRMGLRPGINLDKALQLAAQLEDEEIIRKMKLGK